MTSALALVACSRWVPTRAFAFGFKEPETAYEVTLRALRDLGYQLEKEDEKRGYIRAQAKLDGDAKANGWTGTADLRFSYLNFQVEDDGRVLLRINGYHVRDNEVMHNELSKEVDLVVRTIAELGGVEPELVPAR